MSFLGLGKAFGRWFRQQNYRLGHHKSLENGQVIYSVRNEKRKAELEKIIENGTVLTAISLMKSTDWTGSW